MNLTTLTTDAGSATAVIGASITGAAGVGDCVGDWIDDGFGHGSGDLSSFAAGWAPFARPRLPKEKARRTGFESLELAAATAGAAAAGAAVGTSVRGCRPKSESPVWGARVDRLPKLKERRKESLDGTASDVLDESSGGSTVGGGGAMGSATAGGMSAAGAVAGGGEARGGGEAAGRLIENGDA